ncbi:hypothetical protein F5Y05DRAFT_411088 [Hypoxylon sp. FL0543]|nr:hypothetical protein F5Y05DRAFT_411088 [Hypoxylon sp. FL0543]
MASSPPKPKVYRLRGCPAHLDRLGATELLSQALGDVTPPDIRIQSLATSLDPWARPPTKVGTLMFLRQPALIEMQGGNGEWRFPVTGLEKPLVLDDHFLGMTPLNDVEREKHEFNCIAISGLASHPFGSWQPKGGDKSFMWIRDELPLAIPDTRFSIYGYDTTLVGSNSFQSVEDLAASFIDHIRASGWALPSAKPLLFLAHSLGGIVLKEAFVALANEHEQGAHILDLFKGGIFFGVPSHGMATSHLLAMVEGQVNEQLVHDLSTGSEYLQCLDDRFSGLSLVRDMFIHWAYETKTSPTVIRKPDGSFTRGGLEEILVSKESATRSLYGTRSSAVFPVNRNHSDIVKFLADDPNVRVVVDKLQESCGRDSRGSHSDIGTFPRETHAAVESHVAAKPPQPWAQNSVYRHQSPVQVREEASEGNSTLALPFLSPTADLRLDLMNSLEFPDRNSRLKTIDTNFEHTCEWAFDEEQTSLSRWLKHGEGFFWIHGKPGSGKSTLMKFIVQHQRTWELLHKFPSEAVQISASFFFHDRGSPLQKSFEGLLRSVLFQIVDKLQEFGLNTAELLKLLRIRASAGRAHPRDWTIGDLESCIRVVFQQTFVELDVFLLLDALDEYDGQPDFICDVLNGLMDITANSRTKLKMLVSSRPWEAFQRQFARAPSIQVQDFTKSDIEKYCWGIVEQKGEDISTTLGSIVPAVISRADGVFLWVRLVLLELANEALQGNDSVELANILSSIPSDLQAYYARTVQRIPEKLRWDAYVILEVLSIELPPPQGFVIERIGMDIPTVVAALECSRCSTYEACCAALASQGKCLRTMLKNKNSQYVYPGSYKFIRSFSFSNIWLRRAVREYAEGQAIRISTSTGNLAELVHGEERGYGIQLAHQTVKEFVRSQYFKQTMLGHRARQIQENGYTFIAKYLLANELFRPAGAYLVLHELSTGCHLKDFLDSIPKEYFNRSGGGFFPRPLDGPLAFAVHGTLQLYAEETLRRDPDAFRKTQERLLSVHRYYPFARPVSSQKRATLQHFVLAHGYKVEQDRHALEELMQAKIYITLGMERHSTNSILVGWSDVIFLETMASMLIAHGQDPNTWFSASDGSKTSFHRRRRTQALHLANTATLARCLLEHGSPVNELDWAGNTPLDHALRFILAAARDRVRALIAWKLSSYEVARLLLERGGITKTATREEWGLCLSYLQARGLEIAPFRECLDRIQFDDQRNIGGRIKNFMARLGR